MSIPHLWALAAPVTVMLVLLFIHNNTHADRELRGLREGDEITYRRVNHSIVSIVTCVGLRAIWTEYHLISSSSLYLITIESDGVPYVWQPLGRTLSSSADTKSRKLILDETAYFKRYQGDTTCVNPNGEQLPGIYCVMYEDLYGNRLRFNYRDGVCIAYRGKPINSKRAKVRRQASLPQV